MTIKECEPRIEAVKQRFRDYFQTDFDAEVFLLGKAGTSDKRNALFNICQEPFLNTCRVLWVKPLEAEKELLC